MIMNIVKIQSEPINTEVLLLFGEHSSDLFQIEGIGQAAGLTLSDALKYPETETDAYIYGLVNVTRDGTIFFFTNTTRLAFEINSKGILSLFSYLGHEICHLVRIIQSEGILKANLIKEMDEEETAELTEAIYNAVAPIFIEFLEAHTYGE